MSAKPDSIRSILYAMVAIKAKMRPTGSENGLLDAINPVEREFRQAFPMAKWLFFEPDNRDN